MAHHIWQHHGSYGYLLQDDCTPWIVFFWVPQKLLDGGEGGQEANAGGEGDATDDDDEDDNGAGSTGNAGEEPREEFLNINGKMVPFLVGKRTWPGTGSGKSSVFEDAMMELQELIQVDGIKLTLGSAKALMSSERGYPTHGDATTLVRFGSRTRSYTPSECKGLKVLSTAIQEAGKQQPILW
jgi:hypothetical protein